MSILIDGILASSVARSSGSTTLISASYVRTAFPRRPAAAPFALTLHTLDRGALTVVLPCRISSHTDSDIILGLDWKAALRELLLGLGFPVPATFDPWALFLPLGESLIFWYSGYFAHTELSAFGWCAWYVRYVYLYCCVCGY
jgi:hypothetical protein